MSSVDVSIILACYNEGPTFKNSIGKIVQILEKLDKKWEVIFVEDKSEDDTKESVQKLVSEIKNSRAIYHKNNEGRGKSVMDGIEASRGEICGFLDVDGEISPSYIPIFVAEMRNGADMAIGRRFYENNPSSFVRFVASKLYALVSRSILELPFADTEAGFKFFRRLVILPVITKVKDKEWFWDTEICARAFWAKLKISQVPVLFVRRTDKKSTVRLLPDTWNYLLRLIKFRIENNDRFK